MPAANKNNWSVLGLTKTATEAEIKIAYKKLAREKHPGNCQFKVKHYKKLDQIEIEQLMHIFFRHLDKNTHLPEQQRKEKQEEMKLINVAYETLIKKN